MDPKATIISSIFLFISNLTLIGENQFLFFSIISFLFGIQAASFFQYQKNTKMKSLDLEALISDIMDTYRTDKKVEEKKSPKLCGECRKDKKEGYKHCYECRSCIKDRLHHDIFLDSCVNSKNSLFYNLMIVAQIITSSISIFRSIFLFDANIASPISLWYFTVFFMNLISVLLMTYMTINFLVSTFLKRKKKNSSKLRENIKDIDMKVGHGFARVSVS